MGNAAGSSHPQVMPLIGKTLNMFRLPDEEELNKGLGV